MKKMLVTRPNHDVTTKYISSWAHEIIILAKKKIVDVVDLHKDKANRKEFEGRVSKLKPDIIFLNGHGGPEHVTGIDNEILIQLNDNHQLLGGAITYAVSCESAEILGKKVGEEENTTYIGYDGEFAFMVDTEYLSSPKDDPRARPFMESSNQVMISLLKGNSVEDSVERSKERSRGYCKLLASTADSDDLQAAQLLWWNTQRLQCLGDREAKL